MSANKTQPTKANVAAYLDTVTPPDRVTDAQALDALFRKVTGFEPMMWGASIVGYGRYHYRYESGREGDFLATGIAHRKAALWIYILPGYTDFGPILSRRGKHKIGKSCLYVNKLADVDTNMLDELIRAGLDDLNNHWPAAPF
jgi:hypothetical protein